jgi:uncharacterized protein (TIGR03435 family)
MVEMRAARLFIWVALIASANAQPLPAPPQFEVASIKRCPNQSGPVAGTRKGGSGESSPDRLHLSCQTLMSLIQWSYVVFADGQFNAVSSTSVSGGPAWIDSDRFEIDAKAESPQSWGTLNGPMLRTLLQQRFNLRIRTATREAPVYALTVNKGGAKLQPSKRDCIILDSERPLIPIEAGKPLPAVCGLGRLTKDAQGEDVWDAFAVSMATLAILVSTDADRKVVDRTGLSGVFDIHLPLLIESLGDSTDRPASADTFNALRVSIQKLGLKIEPAKGQIESLIVDRAEQPSEN